MVAGRCGAAGLRIFPAGVDSRAAGPDAGAMGRMVSGKWTTEWYAADAEGRFRRDPTRFHDRISADGSTPFAAEAGRYHLYVSLACPWAHRTLIARKLKKLEAAIDISVVDPYMGDDGWFFSEAPGAIPDGVNGARFLWEIYLKAKPGYTGRVTVPVLWDKRTGAIVNNESRQILRMLDCELDTLGDASFTLCPEALREQIDREIDALYEPVNNGVYRAGFAVTQQAYDEAVTELFEALDGYEQRLSRQRYLLGPSLTEADICLFTTLFRFEPVYHYHFKCNLRRLRDYENLWGYVRDIYQQPGVRETCSLEHIKQHYFRSHERVNPTRIVPKGPLLDFNEPHFRARLG
jgi:glutathionyl-hydroquinone reductase